MQCPQNLYKLTQSYLSERECTLTTNSISVKRSISKGCPQGSCCGPGLWNIHYDSLLNLYFKLCTTLIAFADDVLGLIKGESTLDIQNKANTEIGKISKWAAQNKITFNRSKSQVMLISRKKPRTQQHLNIYLDNRKIEQSDSIKYLGVIVDNRFRLVSTSIM